MIDEDKIESMIESRNYHDRVVMPRVREKIRELIEDIPREFHRERRTEFLQHRIKILNIRESLLTLRYKLYFQRNRVLERMLVGEELDETEKLIQKAQGEIIALRESGNQRHGLTKEDIQRAKEYPFENLIEIRRGMAICPFHDDHDPSFSIKSNYGYCFGCGWRGDVIAFVMERDGLPFGQAVKYLCQL